jgi:hypothetical protein
MFGTSDGKVWMRGLYSVNQTFSSMSSLTICRPENVIQNKDEITTPVVIVVLRNIMQTINPKTLYTFNFL